MVHKKDKIKGVCTGLAITNQGNSICGGIYPAVEKGECRMVPLTSDSEEVEVVEFVNILAHAFIKGDQQWEKKIRFEQ